MWVLNSIIAAFENGFRCSVHFCRLLHEDTERELSTGIILIMKVHAIRSNFKRDTLNFGALFYLYSAYDIMMVSFSFLFFYIYTHFLKKNVKGYDVLFFNCFFFFVEIAFHLFSFMCECLEGRRTGQKSPNYLEC